MGASPAFPPAASSSRRRTRPHQRAPRRPASPRPRPPPLRQRCRGLWARLRQIAFRDVALPSLQAALGRAPGPPLAVSLLDIRVPKQRGRVTKQHWADGDSSVNSLLRAAARLEPEECVFELLGLKSDGSLIVDLPRFHRATSIVLNLSSVIRSVPADVEFTALETLSLSYCTVDIDSLLSCCPRLRTLRLTRVMFDKPVLQVNSPLLQEIAMERWNAQMNTSISIVAPVLKQLSMSFTAWEVSISVLAPMADKVSWHCYFLGPVAFGPWRLEKLTLQKAERQGQLPSLRIYAWTSSRILHGEAHTFTQEMEKHMITDFSVLELHLKTKGHVYGALAFHLLGMNRIRCATQRLNVILHRTPVKEECPFDCSCEPLNWRSQTISLYALKELEINGFEGDDHEIDFLKLIFKCAPMLRKMTLKLSHEASSCNNGGKKIYNILKACSSVEFYVYLRSGLMLDSQNCSFT